MSTASLTLECRQARDTVNALIDFVSEHRDIDPAQRALLRFDLDRALVAIPDLDRAADRRPAVGLLAQPTIASDVLLKTVSGVRDANALALLAGGTVRLPVMRGLLPEHDNHGFTAIIRLTHETDGQAAAKAADTVGRMLGETVRRPADQGVRVEIMSLSDVIIVLSRAYLCHVAPNRASQTLDGTIATLEQIAAANMTSATQGGLNAHHVAAIRHYLETRFADHPRLQLLNAAGYWDAFATLAPRASAEGRRRLASLLWDGLGDFDTIYSELAGALEALNHASDIVVAAEAVRAPQGEAGWGAAHPFSILAVGTLLSEADGAGDLLEARTRFGQPVQVPRNILTALTREVVVVVEGDPSALLARADVLQLPTAVPPVSPRHASARRQTTVVEPAGEPPWLARALAAAKSLYLTETAVAAFDLNGLVVHLGDKSALSPQFAPLLTHWIEQTQGQNPQEREANDTTLFIAVDAPTSASPIEPLKAFLGAGHSAWLDRWGTDSAFDNLFILGLTQRSNGPALQGEPLARLPKSGATGTALATLETALTGLQAGAWQRHVRDAAVAVDEALHAGDGGVVYLAQSIAAIDYARAKRRQLSARLKDICTRLADTIERFLYASAPDAQNDWRHRAALATQARLRATASEHRIGHLIDQLTPRERTLDWMFQRLSAERAAPAESEGLMRRLAALDQLDDASADRLAANYARRVMMHWLRSMRLTCLAPGSPTAFGFTESNFGHLIEELALAAQRCDVEARMAADVLRVLLDTQAASPNSARVAMVAANVLASFISQVGFDSPWSSRHPRRRGTLGAPLFERQAAIGPEDLATLQAGRITLQYTADWCEGIGLMTDETVAAARGMRFEDGEFRELAELLALLSANTRSNSRERVL